MNTFGVIDNILFVIVIFEKNIEQSHTFITLKKNMGLDFDQINLMIYDNTPNKEPTNKINGNVHYVSSGKNDGLSKAYNYGIELAASLSKGYLVVLDQDSTVTREYINRILYEISHKRPDVIVPSIKCQGLSISPYKINSTGQYDFLNINHGGGIYAINSFTVFSLYTLKKINGFNEFYWLDGLDFDTFYKISKENLKVTVMNDVLVEHSLSLITDNISISRLRNIAYYEAVFFFENFNIVACLICFFRLLVRVLKKRRYRSIGVKGILLYVYSIFDGSLTGVARRIKKVKNTF